MNAAHALGAMLVLFGCAFFLASTAGLLRFPDSRSRLHAIVKAENLGLGFLCLGLAMVDGSVPGILRLLAVWVLALLASAMSAFLIAGRAGNRERPHAAGKTAGAGRAR